MHDEGYNGCVLKNVLNRGWGSGVHAASTYDEASESLQRAMNSGRRRKACTHTHVCGMDADVKRHVTQS